MLSLCRATTDLLRFDRNRHAWSFPSVPKGDHQRHRAGALIKTFGVLENYLESLIRFAEWLLHDRSKAQA